MIDVVVNKGYHASCCDCILKLGVVVDAAAGVRRGSR